jgi:hypothetical protein
MISSGDVIPYCQIINNIKRRSKFSLYVLFQIHFLYVYLVSFLPDAHNEAFRRLEDFYAIFNRQEQKLGRFGQTLSLVKLVTPNLMQIRSVNLELLLTCGKNDRQSS